MIQLHAAQENDEPWALPHAVDERMGEVEDERGRPRFEGLLEKLHDLVSVAEPRVDDELPGGDVAFPLFMGLELRQALPCLFPVKE